MVSPGKRAVRADQKEQRRDAIMAATLELFDESSFESVSVAAVAKRAGIAKGTVYLYFETKEEIFLAILAQAFEGLFDQLDKVLMSLPEPCPLDVMSEVLSQTANGDPKIIRLVSILHTALEQNLSYDVALNFKQSLRRRFVYTGGLIEGKLGFSSPGDGMKIILYMHGLLVGFEQMAKPSPTIEEVLQTPGMEVFRIDLYETVKDACRNLLEGMQARAGEG